ncbi:MAG: hypothetical protein QME42_06850, partial [bacterium]|nr:hypothetical protein [bacterium]
MKKYLTIFLSLFLLSSGQILAQETEKMTGPTALQGMRGVPLNIPDISLTGDIVGKVTSNKDDEDRNTVH